MVLIHAQQQGNVASPPLSMRCPVCRHQGLFVPVGADIGYIVENDGWYTAGQRICPRPFCNTVIFGLFQTEGLVISYPAERIDFDATGIPERIVASLDEAITCHANCCYIAAAIMVRKTLELLCHKRGAKGDNLVKRIKVLGAQAILPRELFDGLDDLRLLGNDAAHIESIHFNQVGDDELNVAIAFTKMVLQSVYQYASLLDQMRALRRATE